MSADEQLFRTTLFPPKPVVQAPAPPPPKSPTVEEIKGKFYEKIQNGINEALCRAFSAELKVETEVGSWLTPLLGAWLGKEWVVVSVFAGGACDIHVHRRVPLQGAA